MHCKLKCVYLIAANVSASFFHRVTKVFDPSHMTQQHCTACDMMTMWSDVQGSRARYCMSCGAMPVQPGVGELADPCPVRETTQCRGSVYVGMQYCDTCGQPVSPTGLSMLMQMRINRTLPKLDIVSVRRAIGPGSFREETSLLQFLWLCKRTARQVPSVALRTLRGK